MAKKRSTKKRANFRLEAPEAKQVYLAGSFNDWDATCRPLKQDAAGVWKTWLMLAHGEYEYRYLVDGEWVDDPACEEHRTNEYGTDNCVLRV